MLQPAGSPGTWEPIAEFGSVGWLVPWSDRYATFTRIFHSIQGTGRDTPARWQVLADRAGRTWHPEVQFDSINLLGDAACSATLGNLGREALATLIPLLGAPDMRCIFGLWDGENWISGQDAEKSTTGVDATGWATAGALRAPIREYRCFLAVLGDLARLGLPWVRQPTLAWSNEFCLATDPDYDSTILAADENVRRRVLRCPELEALPVQATTSMLRSADRINGMPPQQQL